MIDARVLKPLMMKSTFVEIPVVQNNKMSTGYNVLLEQTDYWQLPSLAGAGAFKSSSADMALFLKANMTKSLLPDEFTLTHKLTSKVTTDKTGIGLAWIINETKDGKLLIHNGGTGGFRSFIGFNKKTQKGIVILANSAISMDDIGYAYLTNSLEDIALRNPVTISKENLLKLNGKFELTPGFVLTVSNNEDQLFVQATGQQKLPLTAISDNEFISHAVQARIEFKVNDKGEVQSLMLYQGGKDLLGTKL